MPTILLIQSSLRQHSRTAVVVQRAAETLEELGIDHETIDLRDYTLPFCDGRSLTNYFDEYPDVAILHQKIKHAEAYILGYPVYLYSISGVLKNFLDILGGPMSGKYFGIIANAGGKNNYMSSNDLINFMLYDINATAIMPQVYSHKGDFEIATDGSWKLTGFKPLQKVEQMIDALLRKVPNAIVAD